MIQRSTLAPQRILVSNGSSIRSNGSSNRLIFLIAAKLNRGLLETRTSQDLLFNRLFTSLSFNLIKEGQFLTSFSVIFDLQRTWLS